MDRAMGNLRDGLDDQGQRENTILWYCGDNGTPSSGLLESHSGAGSRRCMKVVFEYPESLNGQRKSKHRDPAAM